VTQRQLVRVKLPTSTCQGNVHHQAREAHFGTCLVVGLAVGAMTLVGAVFHHGTSLTSGHYTACTFDTHDGILQWYTHNDANTTKLFSSCIIAASALVLCTGLTTATLCEARWDLAWSRRVAALRESSWSCLSPIGFLFFVPTTGQRRLGAVRVVQLSLHILQRQHSKYYCEGEFEGGFVVKRRRYGASTS
jgi:hypothetical protein